MTGRRIVAAAAVLVAVAACGSQPAGPETTVTGASPATATAAVPVGVDTGSCTSLFGRPGPSTGLDESTCRPERVCEGMEPFVPPDYGDTIDALRARTLVDPPRLLPGDPYGDESLVPADTSGVCAVLPEGAGYRLETFPDRSAAETAGGVVTHEGACGVCSSLQDLAVYLSIPDLGNPVRQCALLGLGGDQEATLECIAELGFSEPCAQIWAFNSANTREACFGECISALDAPHHLADGSLNACLTCDETESGPVFKAVAGRTRRNSGIPSGICRPGAEVAAVLHDSYP